ncbi:MAG: hypothetical protein II207_02945 [Clostridia bacterium]|nr:hypothetical protein [Clostridia bacterium]
MKKKYMKPSIRLEELYYQCQILAGSGDPIRDVPWWDGEAGARQHKDMWEDDEEDDWVEEEF